MTQFNINDKIWSQAVHCAQIKEWHCSDGWRSYLPATREKFLLSDVEEPLAFRATNQDDQTWYYGLFKLKDNRFVWTISVQDQNGNWYDKRKGELSDDEGDAGGTWVSWDLKNLLFNEMDPAHISMLGIEKLLTDEKYYPKKSRISKLYNHSKLVALVLLVAAIILSGIQNLAWLFVKGITYPVKSLVNLVK